jgi:hypothetical protein
MVCEMICRKASNLCFLNSCFFPTIYTRSSSCHPPPPFFCPLSQKIVEENSQFPTFPTFPFPRAPNSHFSPQFPPSGFFRIPNPRWEKNLLQRHGISTVFFFAHQRKLQQEEELNTRRLSLIVAAGSFFFTHTQRHTHRPEQGASRL